MLNSKGTGKTFQFTGTAKNAGDLVAQGKRVGVVAETVASTEIGVAVTEGEFEVTAVSGDTWAAGDLLYFDVAHGNRLTKTASTNPCCAWAVAAKTSSTTGVAALFGGAQA